MTWSKEQKQDQNCTLIKQGEASEDMCLYEVTLI